MLRKTKISASYRLIIEYPNELSIEQCHPPYGTKFLELFSERGKKKKNIRHKFIKECTLLINIINKNMMIMRPRSFGGRLRQYDINDEKIVPRVDIIFLFMPRTSYQNFEHLL